MFYYTFIKHLSTLDYMKLKIFINNVSNSIKKKLLKPKLNTLRLTCIDRWLQFLSNTHFAQIKIVLSYEKNKHFQDFIRKNHNYCKISGKP